MVWTYFRSLGLLIPDSEAMVLSSQETMQIFGTCLENEIIALLSRLFSFVPMRPCSVRTACCIPSDALITLNHKLPFYDHLFVWIIQTWMERSSPGRGWPFCLSWMKGDFTAPWNPCILSSLQVGGALILLQVRCRSSPYSQHEFCPLLTTGRSSVILPCAQNYRHSFRENKLNTLVFYDWIRAFWACFHENAGL